MSYNGFPVRNTQNWITLGLNQDTLWVQWLFYDLFVSHVHLEEDTFEEIKHHHQGYICCCHPQIGQVCLFTLLQCQPPSGLARN